jgi:hypothetical protein
MDRNMTEYAHQMQLTVQQALRLATIRLLEGVEYTAAHDAYQRAEAQAQEYAHTAEEYQLAADRDAYIAMRQRQRGEYLQHVAETEASEAAMHAAVAQQDDTDRLQLLNNITQLKQDENQTLQALDEEVHEGACSWYVVASICRAVGGATQLQNRANEDYLAIHRDWKVATQLGRDEVWQRDVADMLTNRSSRYADASEDLRMVADRWDAQAQRDYETAKADNVTASKLFQKATRDEAIMHRDADVEYKIDRLVHGLLQRAEEERTTAYWFAVGAILGASGALIFFGQRVVTKTPQAWKNTQTDTPTLAYVGVHLLIFLGIVGVTGHYWLRMDAYTTIQRAVILLWFATLASLTQTIALHAVPWTWEVLSSTHEPPPFMVLILEVSTRYVVFFALFLLEVLHVWLVLGHGFFQEGWISFLASWPIRIFVVAAIAAYGWYIEVPRRQQGPGEGGQDEVSSWTTTGGTPWPENQSIVMTNSSNAGAPSPSSASEVTPLRKADLLSWGTTIDLAAGHGSRGASTTTSMASSVYQALWEDLVRLVFPLEILFVACMVAVLRTSLHLVWISHATWIQYGMLMCTLGLVLAAFWLAREVCFGTKGSSGNRQPQVGERATFSDVPSATNEAPKFEMVQQGSMKSKGREHTHMSPHAKPWISLVILCLVVPTPAWTLPSSTAHHMKMDQLKTHAVSNDAVADQQFSTDMCRSNETHIAWIVLTDPSQDASQKCVYQSLGEAKQDAYHFLRENVMPFDLPLLETLGFHDEDTENPLPDGLDDGIIGQTILYAIRAKQMFPYCDALPKEIWQEYVLNYANTNEARSNWRPLFHEKLRPLVDPQMNISQVVHAINANMWKGTNQIEMVSSCTVMSISSHTVLSIKSSVLAPKGTDEITFKAGSTPLIFDPMSVLVFGYASCSGVSIVLVNALRSVGVPARVVGTAAWYQDAAQGNHNWVSAHHKCDSIVVRSMQHSTDLLLSLFSKSTTRWKFGKTGRGTF